MAKIKDLFHDVGNCLNRISMGAGIAKMEITDDFKDKPTPPQIKNALGRLNDAERHAMEANAMLKQLREVIYNLVDPDTDRKKNEEDL